MTAFAPANLPASVNSLPKLVAWSCGAFYQLHRNSEYQETENGVLVPLITAQDGKAGNDTERIIFRVSLELSATWRESTSPFWVNVVSPSSASIPTVYLP
jgi:hypothetical protein